MLRFLLNRPARGGQRHGPTNHPAFWRDQSGGVLIYTAFGMAVFIGVAALSVDVGFWYATKRTVQNAADAAALAAALEVARGSDEATALSLAQADAELNGLVLAAGTTLDVNNPPESGSYTTDLTAAEATVNHTVPGFLSSFFRDEPTTVAARAVARGFIADNCIYVLNPTEDGALSIAGTATVELDCGAQVNSTGPTAIDQVGSSCLTATAIATAGGASGSCLDPSPQENAYQVEDPFSYLSPPTIGPCTFPALVEVTSPTTLNPGNYCGGLKIEDDVTFNPGTYVMDGEGLQIQGNSVVTGDEVSFHFPSTVTGYDKPGPTPPQSVYIAGTTDVQLSAPTAGDYQGVLLYHDPAVDPNIQLVVEGGADMELEGIIYAPNNHMRFAGGSEGTDGWVVIAVDTLEFTGNSYVTGTATPAELPLALITPKLVE